eukprot:CAMPEP_0185788860 /NCGR_PEP_ID=MMETSP1174-20130828/148146_1 /TAXON_ID=35687 /ORGANISM="Dictyocha speculum, Strain CCMP1381" /LENGTH=47 /DNA_ID= /DNA_START= /DNA_END= /DNA_ORIENTATION=
MRWKQASRRRRRGGMVHVPTDSDTWCKMCDGEVPEDGKCCAVVVVDM